MRCLIILSLASTVLSGSPLHRRHGFIKARRIEERAVEALDFDAAAIFPPPLLEKRGLVGLLGDVVGGVTTIVSDLLDPTTTTATPTSTAASSSNAQGGTTAQSTVVTNSPNTSASASPSPTPSAGAGTTNAPTGNSSAGGLSGASGGAIGGTNNSFHTTTTPQVVTDHEGNTLTLTGPVTRTWVTTFPNGVVSTVTEVLTPTVDVAGAEPPISMAPGKIAAIVGTIVTVFLVICAAAFVFLMIRKRQKRRIGLLDSRPDSIASFGSVSDEFNSERKMSNAAAVPTTSVSSFLTAPAHVDGMQMDFPLPPVPAAESRPVSSLSDATFDFSQYRMSRSSIIEDRNRFRKIGQYPDVDSYTPFVLPPSEFGHSEEASGGTPRVSIVADHDRSLGASSTGSNLTGGNPVLLGTENPFVDPVTVPQAIHMTTGNGNPLVNSAARRSTLWRTSTFGPTSYTPPARRPSRVASISRNTMASMASSEYDTALDHVDDGTGSNSPPSRHPSTSTSHFSYHSAFEAYAQAPIPEDPFVDQQLPTVPTNMPPPRLTYPALRPNTATSSGATSAVSSVGNGTRELGGTPDPNDLFYRNSTERIQALGGRISEESRARSDAGTVRGTHVAYPALRDSFTARGTSP